MLTDEHRALFEDLGVADDLADAPDPQARRVVALSFVLACGLVIDAPGVEDVLDHAGEWCSGSIGPPP